MHSHASATPGPLDASRRLPAVCARSARKPTPLEASVRPLLFTIVGLVAISVVVVFDQLIPPDRQPPYLAGSRLRPLFSAAGQMGLKSLPPDIAAYVDRLKRDRRS